jgi:prepilin-type N-terminal cleavage/methylation domain-containing protein
VLRQRPESRAPGFTLVELLVAMTVAGVVVSLVTLTGLRQQRLLSDLSNDASLAAQLHEAAAILPVDIRALSPAAGDVRDARDTALEMRSTIASGVVCDTAARSLVLPPATEGADTYATYASPIEAGDSVWLFTPGDSMDTWQPRAITSVGSARPADRCSRTASCAARASRSHSIPRRPSSLRRGDRFASRDRCATASIGRRTGPGVSARANGIRRSRDSMAFNPSPDRCCPHRRADWASRISIPLEHPCQFRSRRRER